MNPGAVRSEPCPAGEGLPQPMDLLNALPSPLILLDDKGAVRLANAAAEIFFNMSQGQLMERGWETMFAPDSPVLGLIHESRLRRQAITAYDIPLELPADRRMRVDIQTGLMPDASGWLSVSIVSRAAATFVDRQSGHAGAARAASGVAAMLAHEIKNPLSGIRGAAQLLETAVDEEGRELTRLIISEVERVRLLIDRMENFTDTRPRAMQAENIHAILGHVRALAEKGFAAGVQFQERYDPSLPAALCDRDALVQLFLNLVKNAVEASPPGGIVTLQTGFRQGYRVRQPATGRRVSLPLEVAVIDEGPGPPAHIAGHLFEPFVSARVGGTGLGLALVAKVVADHGGLVECDRVGNRTLFRVLLPAAPPGA
jgi:two-component system nitrogen regulation sensor histidine kinase GlnL